jgi:DnaK suppressor protein
MSRKEALTKLRDVLLLRREALRRALDGDMSMLQTLSQEGGDVMDAAMDTAQDEISSQLVEVESRELNQIDDALGRFREGIYGNCDACDKPIPLARLQAVPYATNCIECARKQERGGYRPTLGFGDSHQSSNASR